MARRKPRPIPAQTRVLRPPKKRDTPSEAASPRLKRLFLHLGRGTTWLLAKLKAAWAFIVKWKKFSLLGCLSAVAGSYALFVTALSITPGEPPTSNPFTVPFVITNQRSLLWLEDVNPNCDVNRVDFKGQLDSRFEGNDFGGYRKPIPVLGPGEQATVYCGRTGAPIDMGPAPVSFADVTVSIVYGPPLHLPCYGMKWQRFITYADSEGKLKWKPYGFSEDPVPKSTLIRRRFHCF
jgi:hypothetical protein